MATESREFEIVLWGASGFTGKLVADYLQRRYGADLRWALGGRNRSKLEAVRDDLMRDASAPDEAREIPILIGDSDDENFLRELAGRTQVICTTVGPFAKYGSKLVAACAAKGTNYCDLTGEVHWMKEMIETHQDAARESGARIVFNCGFDCIPSDLGAYFLQREMKRRHGVACSAIQFRVKGFSGGASGGTIASMLNMLEEAGRDRSVIRAMVNPYSLYPKGEARGLDAAEGKSPVYDNHHKQWTAPFVMAGINTKVVRRSNALLDYAYGRDFRYDEAVLTGGGIRGYAKAAANAYGTAAMVGAMMIGPLRRALSGRFTQPGDGPTKSQREKGFFNIALRGEHPTDAGKSLTARVRGDRDPGYGSTSKMLSESAICLARDEISVAGGFWTTASAMGDLLLARLAENAGVTFTLED